MTEKKGDPKLPTLRKALGSGDVLTRMSALIMGFGNICRGQIIKGVLYLASEVAFIMFMVMHGGRLLAGLRTLGTSTGDEVFNEAKQVYEYTAGDNSMLFLLYGLLTIFLIIFFVFIWSSSIKSAYEVQILKKENEEIPKFKDDLRGLMDQNLHKFLLSGPMICVFAFTILPLVFMAAIAFTNYDRNHQSPGKLFHWVGLTNFKTLLDSGNGLGYAFWHVLGWTFIWAIFATFLNYIFGMILAIIINRKDTKLKSFWRFMFVLSIAVPQFVSLLIIRTMLQPEGAVNVLLEQMHIINKALPFWTDVTWARVTIIIVNLWIGIPFTMLQVTGILQNIPKELYEAADVDGAGAMVKFFEITLPYMLFVTTPYLITQFIGNINNFNVIYLLTKGAPASLSYNNGTAGKTDLLVTWLYKLTMDFKDYNYAAVISIAVFILSAVFSLLAYRQSGAIKNEEGFQ